MDIYEPLCTSVEGLNKICSDTDSSEYVCSRCGNLLQNPGFEAGLSGWDASTNVKAMDQNPFEGTQVAQMGPAKAFIFQDISLVGVERYPLLFSFEVFPGPNSVKAQGNLIVEVLWLDKYHNPIGLGLRLFIPESAINNKSHITFFDITDSPSYGAAFARLLFSKSLGKEPEEPDTLQIDQVILAPVSSKNLVQNPGFQLGLEGWNAIFTGASYLLPYEGSGKATTTGKKSAELIQDICIKDYPSHSSFLFGFAAGSVGAIPLSVQVLWLDEENNPIGEPGIDYFIPKDTLPGQENYLTYLDLTNRSPKHAVKARIQFTCTSEVETGIDIDKVLFAKAACPNLVQNPSFKNGLDHWSITNTGLEVQDNQAYEGTEEARINSGGGTMFQDIPIFSVSGHCFLFNFGYFRGVGEQGDLLAEVHWLDKKGDDIGLGLSIIVPKEATLLGDWLVYTGITEPVPQGAASARIQFSKTHGDPAAGSIYIDKVLFGCLV